MWKQMKSFWSVLWWWVQNIVFFLCSHFRVLFFCASQMCSINFGSADFWGIRMVIAFLLYQGAKVPDLYCNHPSHLCVCVCVWERHRSPQGPCQSQRMYWNFLCRMTVDVGLTLRSSPHTHGIHLCFSFVRWLRFFRVGRPLPCKEMFVFPLAMPNLLR